MSHRKAIPTVAAALGGLVLVTLLVPGCLMIPPCYNPNKVDLSKYQRVTVQLFDMGPEVTMPPESNKLMCDQAVQLINRGSGKPFEQVQQGLPEGKTDELVMHGVMTKYEPGSQLARFLLSVAGLVSVEGEVCLLDGETGQELSRSMVKSFFGCGGILGGLTSGNDIVRDFGSEIGRGVVRAKKASK